MSKSVSQSMVFGLSIGIYRFGRNIVIYALCMIKVGVHTWRMLFFWFYTELSVSCVFSIEGLNVGSSIFCHYVNKCPKEKMSISVPKRKNSMSGQSLH